MTDADVEREFEDVLQHMARFPGVTAPAELEDRVLKSVKASRLEAPAEVPDLNVVMSCTFCHGKLVRTEAAYCASCLAPHHGDCFASHGSCAIPGCDERELVEPRRVEAPTRKRRWWRSPWIAASLGAAVMASASAFGVAVYRQKRLEEDTQFMAEFQRKAEEIDRLRSDLYADPEDDEREPAREFNEAGVLIGGADVRSEREFTTDAGPMDYVVVHLRNGRAVRGLLRKRDGQQVTLEVAGGLLSLNVTQIDRIEKVGPPGVGPSQTSHIEVTLGNAVGGHLEAGAKSPWLRLRRPPGAGSSFAVFLEAPDDAKFSLAVYDGTEQAPPANPDPGRGQTGSGHTVWSMNAFDPFMWLRVTAVEGAGAFRVIVVEDVVALGREGLELVATGNLGERIEAEITESGVAWVAIETGGAKGLTLTRHGPEGADQDMIALLGRAGGPFLTPIYWAQLGDGSSGTVALEMSSDVLYVRVFGELGPFSLELTID